MISFQNLTSIKKINTTETERLIKKIILSETKEVGDIVCLFCDDNYLLNINIKYLNHDYFTDVITFDYCEKDIISGDILISLERVVENAKKYNVSFLTEFYRVVIHGLLHLLGYNDKTKSEKELMRKKENYYLLKYKEINQCN
ncbi:MAG: rRNA maturation RNase YbeY [Flavobacteriales bacterium]|nr:rRNA maturation RNase YbeY [Flavobacteriales bacterium]